MLDENRWIAARHGLDGEMVDLPELRARPHDARSPAASATGCASTRRTSAPTDELAAIDDLLEHGNGAHRQAIVYEANHDLDEVVREIAEATVPEPPSA